MARTRCKDPLTYRLQVLIHQSLGAELDAEYPPESVKRRMIVDAIRESVEDKIHRLIADSKSAKEDARAKEAAKREEAAKRGEPIPSKPSPAQRRAAAQAAEPPAPKPWKTW